ncbi:ATP-binding protein [Vibrio lamellibrachiae]|uniref:ATP-binding protein n=1 Tax=Vibrio lamellibrachiae TaxID=2910253 RepID=UPI003D13AFD2
MKINNTQPYLYSRKIIVTFIFVIISLIIITPLSMVSNYRLFTSIDRYSVAGNLLLTIDAARLNELIYSRDHIEKYSETTIRHIDNAKDIAIYFHENRLKDGMGTSEIVNWITQYRASFVSYVHLTNYVNDQRQKMSIVANRLHSSSKKLKETISKSTDVVTFNIKHLQNKINNHRSDIDLSDKLIENLNKIKNSLLNNHLTINTSSIDSLQSEYKVLTSWVEIDVLNIKNTANDRDLREIIEDSTIEMEKVFTLSDNNSNLLNSFNSLDNIISNLLAYKDSKQLVIESLLSNIELDAIKKSELDLLNDLVTLLLEDILKSKELHIGFFSSRPITDRDKYKTLLEQILGSAINRANYIYSRLREVDQTITTSKSVLSDSNLYLVKFDKVSEISDELDSISQEMVKTAVMVGEKLSYLRKNRFNEMLESKKTANYTAYSSLIFFILIIWLSYIMIKNQYRISSISKRLRRANEKAQKSNIHKSRFLATMSHEIRTPMNAIIGMTQLLSITKTDNKQAHYLKNIDSSSNYLLSIINDILDISKIESNKFNLNEIDYRLSNLISDIRTILEVQSNDKNILLEFYFDNNIPDTLTLDEIRLKQVIINLASNAIKFTDYGKVIIKISLIEVIEKIAMIEFSISDTGIGISNDQKEKIFNSFTQAESSTNRIYGGTGLGLSISSSIIRIMGGEIKLKSKVNHGSEFSFCLGIKIGKSNPIISDEKTKIREVCHSEQDHNFSQETTNNLDPMIIIDKYKGNLKNKRVLLVEDNIINQEISIELMSLCSINVEVVSNGREAIEKLGTVGNIFHCILMDCQMPVLDGYEATKLIRDTMPFIDAPIIALTANMMDDELERAKNSGMCDVINKPIEINSMFSTLEKWVLRHNQIKDPIRVNNICPNISSLYKTSTIFENLESTGQFDIRKGLVHLNQDSHLYIRLLNRFLNENYSKSRFMSEVYTKDSLIFHTIRGLSDNLGMSKLNYLIEGIDLNPPNEEKQLHLLYEEIGNALELVNKSILESISNSNNHSVLDGKHYNKDIITVKNLLKENNVDVLYLFNGIINNSDLNISMKEFNSLKVLVDSFEFEEALDKLVTFSQQYNHEKLG